MMESALDWHTARALLEWQVELGVDEAIGEEPIDRFTLAEAERAEAAKSPSPGPVAPASSRVAEPEGPDPVLLAKQAAAAAATLEALREALADFDRCDLKKGARSLVFADGNPKARIMVIGEAPGADEDRQGKPFVGRAGQLLDRMFAAVGKSREAPDAENALYITNVLPWRPPQNRDPKPDEVAMMLPFLQRHVELADPDVLVLMGNHSCQALLGRRGITRLRGHWQEALGKPAMPMFHPAYLLRQPHAKRDAWHDLLTLQAKLRG